VRLFGTVSAFINGMTAVTLLAATAAYAAEVPGGSWKQSCSNASFNGKRLSATCARVDGSFQKSNLGYSRACAKGSSVSNMDGNLVCDQYRAYAMPNGSWTDSCREPVMKGPLLVANCKRMDGSWMQSSIDVFQCDGAPVSNRDGTLSCN
jgi:hypothetical protein